MTDALDNNSTQIPTQMARYLSGECSAAEVAAVERWVGEDPARATLVDRLRAEWERAARVPPEASLPRSVDTRAGWGALTRRLGLDEGAGRHSRTVAVPSHSEELARGTSRAQSTVRAQHLGVALLQLRPRGVGGRRPAIAASLLVALAVGLAISTLRHGARTVPLGREYATAPGQRLSVMLVDGTRLILAPASRARLAANYGQGAGGSREVELEGEAYFAVVHDAAHPFAVHAGNAMTTDVGTQFAVRAYVGDAAVHIAVAEGQVSVRPLRVLGARSAVSAAAGDVVSVTDTGVAVTHGVNVAALTIWVDGGLVFQHATVAEVAREISRTFDVDVRVAEATLARRHVTAAFGHDADSLEAVLSYLGLALDARVTRVGRVVTLAPRAP